MTNNENIESRFCYYPFVNLVQFHIFNQVDSKKFDAFQSHAHLSGLKTMRCVSCIREALSLFMKPRSIVG